jgi:glutathione S-transferase
MITVHHLSNSHSHVVLWLLEELGTPYNVVLHQRDPTTGRSPETLRAIHPAAKAPTIVDHGVAMIESAGIIMYVLEAYGAGRLRPPSNTADAMRFYQWLTFIEGSAKGPLLQSLYLARASSDEETRRSIQATASSVLGLLDEALKGNDTIVPGLFTAADIQLTFFEELMEATGAITHYDNLRLHMSRMRQRDAYKRAEEKGGPVGLRQLFAGQIGRANVSTGRGTSPG